MHQRLSNRRILLLVVALHTFPLAWLIAPIIGPLGPLRFIDYGAAWVYAICIGIGTVCLSIPSDVLLARFPMQFPHSLRWLGSVVFGQTRLVWIGVFLALALLSGVVAGMVTRATQNQHGVWVKLAVDSSSPAAPPIRLHYGSLAGQSQPFEWQPYEQSIIAVRPVGTLQGIFHVIAIDTDRGRLGLDQVTVRLGTPDQIGLAVGEQRGALLSWMQPSRAITLTLAPGSGTLEMLWFDQHTTVDLSPQPVRVALRLPAAFQGWTMLPPEAIQQLTLELPPNEQPYAIRQFEIFSDPPQIWNNSTSSRWSASECSIQEQNGTSIIRTSMSRACAMQIEGMQPFNLSETRVLLWCVTWGAVMVLGLTLLLSLSFLFHQLQQITAHYQTVETRLGSWIRQRAEQWPTRRMMEIVWSVALVFHLIYVLNVPMGYTNDSVGYYEFGEHLLASPRLATYVSERTPGYPVFIAGVVALFGETAIEIVVLQHLVLSFLAPLTVWALARRGLTMTGVVAGLAVALMPALCIMGNFIQPEALYTACSTAGLLVYLGYGTRVRPLILVGMLSGVAVMVRPVGIALPAAFVGWMLVQGWFYGAAGVQEQRATAIGCGALLLGYIMIAGFLHIHLAVVRHTTDVSNGQGNYGTWEIGVFQRRIGPEVKSVLPDQAVWEERDLWLSHPQYLSGLYPSLITGFGDFMTRYNYYHEASQEGNRLHPVQRRVSQFQALLYNMTLRWVGDEQAPHWTDLNYISQNWVIPDQQPPVISQSPSLYERMVRVTYRWFPKTSLVRSICLAMGMFVLHWWIYPAILALLSVVVLLARRPISGLMPSWLYWIVYISGVSYLGYPADRYVVILEPLMYILAGAFLGTLLTTHFRRVLIADKGKASSTVQTHLM